MCDPTKKMSLRQRMVIRRPNLGSNFSSLHLTTIDTCKVEKFEPKLGEAIAKIQHQATVVRY